MRPGRILLFLLAVVLTLFILSLLTVSRRAGEVTLPHGLDTPAFDSSGVADNLYLPASENDSSAETGDQAAKVQVPAGASVNGTASTSFSTAGRGTASTSVNTAGNNTAGTAGTTPGTGAASAAARPSVIYPGDIIRDSVAGGNQVRIIYYGDSQVEGDRVTSLLRKELRKEGGGTGPGMISPVMPVMYTRSWVVRSSSNWRRYTLLDYRNGTLSHNRLGPMLALCRFTPPGDSLQSLSFATVKISAVTGADPEVSTYDNLRIFYGNNHDTVLVGIR